MIRAKRFLLILTALIVLSLCLSSCMDMGGVADGEEFKSCFDSVHLLDRREHTRVSIDRFSAFDAESSSRIEDVIDLSDYCYVAFQAEEGYTLTISELAFFGRAEGETVIRYEVYVTDALPEMILNPDGSYTTYPDELGDVPELDPETAITEKIFSEDKLVGSSSLRTDEDWDSTHIKLDRDVILSEGNYLVIKFCENTVTEADTGTEGEPPVLGELNTVNFTLNYLLFYFEEVVN